MPLLILPKVRPPYSGHFKFEPSFSFSHDKIDIGKIFIGSHHTYEVIISNRGQIDGKFTFDQSQTALGRQFEFTPMTGIVPSARLVKFFFK